MSIIIEDYDPTKEYSITFYSQFFIIEDYFNFELNDIELNLFMNILREGKGSKLLIKYNDSSLNANLNDLLLKEQNYKSYEQSEKYIYDEFNKLYSHISEPFLNLTSYPYYKNTFFDLLKWKIIENINNEYNQIYLFTLLLSKRNQICGKIYDFYKKKFLTNLVKFSITDEKTRELKNFSPDENISSLLNAVGISDGLTKDMINSKKFNDFSAELAKWYSLSENINVNLAILNEFFKLNFDVAQEKLDLEKNFGSFSLTFAKKSLLKLINFSLKKLELNINLADLDYKKLLLVFSSILSLGDSIEDFIFRDIKQIAFLGGAFFNFLLNKITSKIENYSNTLEISKLKSILRKLNNKLMIIDKKLYKILKYSLRSKLMKFIRVKQFSEEQERFEEKKKTFRNIMIKYLKGSENLNQDEYTEILKECENSTRKVEITKDIDNSWVLLNTNNISKETNMK